MKKLIIALLLIFSGIIATGQVTEKAFNKFEGSYLVGSDTIKVSRSYVVIDGEKYSTEIDFGNSRNYGIELSRNNEVYYVTFKKRSYGTYLTVGKMDDMEFGFTALLAEQHKL